MRRARLERSDVQSDRLHTLFVWDRRARTTRPTTPARPPLCSYLRVVPSLAHLNDERMLRRRPNCSFFDALTEPSSIIFCSRSVSLPTKSLDAASLVMTLT